MSPAASRIRRVFSRPALLLAFAALAGNAMAREARVAAASLQITPVPAARQLRVMLRLADTPGVTSAMARSAAGDPVPAAWTDFGAAPPAHCAWLLVVDTSNPARQRTVEACAEEARSFLKQLPPGDVVMLASLARDLVMAAPFESTQEQKDAALAGLRADGDAALTTLIYQNVKHALTDHLARREEARRCVVLLTDGKDETPGGPLRVTERRNELITEARRLGIPVHTLGFAEKATEANFFADLKETSLQTDGLHVAAEVASRRLPADTWQTLIGVMHGGGTASLDLSALKQAVPLKLELMTASGRKATVDIPLPQVQAAMPAPAPAAASPAPVAVQPAESLPAPGTPSLPSWAWWAGAGAALLLLLIMKARKGPPPAAPAPEPPPARPAPAKEAPPEEPAAPPLAFLEVEEGKKRHPLGVNGAKIGSGRHNDIVIKHDSLSESHCAVTMTDSGWVIADIGSVNGLRVNGTYYHQASLSHGDVVELGEVKMRFLAES